MSSFVYSNSYETAPLFLGMRAGSLPLELELLFTSAFYEPNFGEASQFTLQDAFGSLTGSLIFFGEVPLVPERFAKSLAEFEPIQDAKILWLLNPNAPKSEWVYSTLKVKRIESGYELLNDVKLDLCSSPDSYFMALAIGSVLSLNADEDKIICVGSDGSLKFGRGSEGLPLNSDLNILPAKNTGTMLSFKFDIPGGEHMVKWLNQLDVGIRYSTQDTTGTLTTINYPIFSTHRLHGALVVDAKITVSNINSLLASQLTASPKNNDTNLLISNFRTVTGRSLFISVSDSPLTLNFAPTANGSFSLAPEGKFKVTVSDKTQKGELEIATDPLDHELALGSSGTEYFRITPTLAEDLYVSFKAGYPAHFIGGSLNEPTFSDLTTTSYLSFHSSGAIEYYAQPAGEGTLYMVNNVSTNPDIPLLPYLPMIAADIPPAADAPFLPIVPLAGVGKSVRDAALQLERSAISPARKAILGIQEQRLYALGKRKSGLPQHVPFNDEGKFTAITPRGLEAGFSKDQDNNERWEYVQIARLLGGGGNAGELRFAGENGIVEPLKSALLTNEQFIVISNPDAIAPFFSGDDASITLKDWKFLLDPSNWKSHGTILIIKNASLAGGELIGDTGAWSEAAKFNKSPSATSIRLKEIAAKARAEINAKQERYAKVFPDEDPVNTDLDFFVNVVLDSPDWNGFLFLDASLGKFPDDLAGMRAGIKLGGLKAHHLGITQTPFTSLEELQTTSSSMFGLIRYEDKRQSFGNLPRFDFRVKELGVSFENSDIRDFRALVDLAMGPLFGQNPQLLDGGPAVIEMEGIRHKRTSGDTYNFTSLESIGIRLGDGPLRSMCIEQGEFVTSAIDPEVDGMTQTLFSFAGSLEFSNLEEQNESFDLFSFDELAFNDLVVHMDFVNNAPESPFYQFDIENLQCDESLSKARGGSLFEGFPVRTEKVFFNEGKSPGALGIMTVQLPDPPGGLPKNWYGLSFNLDMGTLSDAAGAVGLESKLLLAWGPGKRQYFCGLEISGLGLSGSGNELSLLGVLKLKTYSLSLRKSDNVWALLMHGMKLGIFSKSLPAGGSFDFYIFGNPDSSGASSSLGWYGAYVDDEKKKEAKTTDLPDRGKLVQLTNQSKPVNLRHIGGANNQEY